MIYGTKELLERAKQGGYAVGAFNTINVETTRAIIDAAVEERSPVIVQMTEKTFDYAGGRAIFNYVKHVAEFYASSVPIAIHLDHGKSFEVVERSIEIGFPSVMYDGSRKSYADNVRTLQKVVALAKSKQVSVQGELGSVPYLGEISMEDVDWNEYMTDPAQAQDFVQETGIDTLAVAIGNAHGFFRERSVPDFERLSAVAARVSVPLVLHGASDWESERVTEVIRRGIACFNVDTAVRLAFIGGLRKILDSSDETDLRKILGAARHETKEAVQKKMRMFGSAGKASEIR
jgi:ketose-bisphosphate aldolase